MYSLWLCELSGYYTATATVLRKELWYWWYQDVASPAQESQPWHAASITSFLWLYSYSSHENHTIPHHYLVIEKVLYLNRHTMPNTTPALRFQFFCWVIEIHTYSYIYWWKERSLSLVEESLYQISGNLNGKQISYKDYFEAIVKRYLV